VSGRKSEPNDPPTCAWQPHNGGWQMVLSGDWLREGPEPACKPMPGTLVGLDASGVSRFDSTLPAFLLARLREAGCAGDPAGLLAGLPEELRGLLELATAVPEETESGKSASQTCRFGRLGRISLDAWQGLLSVTVFTGECLCSVGRLLRGRAKLRGADFLALVQECGAAALPIVSLISFLIGLILAFVGNVQLASFGASLYVADLVAIAMLREMGVMMTAIIVSGRTGAAFAAHLGSMKANQEIDALRTFGFNPFDFLVLPRMLALVLMMPILTVYANIIGILGGMVVGMAADIPPVLYWNQTLDSVTLTTASLGVLKSVVFGAAIAMCGCLQGMAATGSSAGVGKATTRAVVAAITTVIVLDSAFAAIFTVLDI
jgi:phospholipid/cholesterol/gamma-HCH transport system permease protein